jgi:hypothetical protein
MLPYHKENVFPLQAAETAQQVSDGHALKSKNFDRLACFMSSAFGNLTIHLSSTAQSVRGQRQMQHGPLETLAPYALCVSLSFFLFLLEEADKDGPATQGLGVVVWCNVVSRAYCARGGVPFVGFCSANPTLDAASKHSR